MYKKNLNNNERQPNYLNNVMVLISKGINYAFTNSVTVTKKMY